MACYRTFPRSERGRIKRRRGGRGRRACRWVETAKPVTIHCRRTCLLPLPPPPLLAFSPSFSASDDVLEPRLRTCDNETMAGLTECEYIYIYIEANNEHYSCIEMSVNNRHPPPPSNSKSGSVERGGRGRKGGGGRNASGMVKKSIRR